MLLTDNIQEPGRRTMAADKGAKPRRMAGPGLGKGAFPLTLWPCFITDNVNAGSIRARSQDKANASLALTVHRGIHTAMCAEGGRYSVDESFRLD